MRRTHWFHSQSGRLFPILAFLLIVAAIPLALFVNKYRVAYPQATTGVTALPDTTNNIHLAMAYESQTSLSQEAGVIDYVWGGDYPEQPAHVSKSFYIQFDRSGGYPGDIGFPVYYDLSWFQANHPDWIVYKCDRTTIPYEYGDPNVPIDITNPAVLQFILTNWVYPALDIAYTGVGFDGIDFDNVNLANGFDRCGVWTTDSSGNKVWKYLYGDANGIHGPLYQASIVNWAKYMYNAIHTHKPGTLMTVNYSPTNGGDPSHSLSWNEQLLPYIDMAWGENIFAENTYTTDSDWQVDAEFSADLAAQNKGQVHEYDWSFSTLSQQQKQWALANYLLVKGSHTYLRIGDSSNFGSLDVIPEYSAPIGSPTNTYYQSQGVYMRDFTHGKAIVNPSSSQSFTITLPANTYTDLYGNRINSVTLSAPSGIVLLATSNIVTPTSVVSSPTPGSVPTLTPSPATSNIVTPTSVVSSPTPRPLPTLAPSPAASDTTPPTVKITFPLNGGTVTRRSSVTIIASVSDKIGVTRVTFSINGSLLCTTTAFPYSCSWSVPRKLNAHYIITVKAYDAAGNAGKNSVRVTASLAHHHIK